ncbi:lysine--tRNA ligase [Stratiformator vulcanicus]|uniref:Lysine--tRNA ligase n=1 Tax=Stratiformator vulcanicus TaxID=2527980 RepID=A0A517R3K6_9PLAN|nr:lysine--tRNA ligase [Stratiformator vulcanicus]QDT38479.1 Lysine--tRNA ligase [Stratiformator vulcanicus]
MPAPGKPDRLEQARRDKMDKIRELGHDPFGQRFDGHIPIADVREQCPEESGVAGDSVRVAGRVMGRRKAGKLRFYVLKDATETIQLLFSRGDLPVEQWELMSATDLGDLIGIDGVMWRTDSGEVSIKVETLTMLCKSLAPPPEKHSGLQDVETLLRHRSLDLIYSEGVLERMLKRTKIIASVRKTLAGRGFVEVETPVLHNVAGGAAARPFTTHHNALDIDLFLRIALELHLKRLMVGGIEKVYEIGRVFRNEGIDQTHNPEFTMTEIYQAYGDYETMMDLTESLIVEAAKVVADDPERPVLPWDGGEIDFTPPFERKTYGELFKEYAGCEMSDSEGVASVAKKHGIETAGRHPDVIVSDVFEATVEDNLVGPIFVKDYPASICPLTKRKQNDPSIAERFELFVHGMELANAYTELNDPLLQEELFTQQLDGQAEEDSMAKMDREFLQALKIGMPPAGGLGIGIDRLVMLLTDTRSIRDVILFPTLRPEAPQSRAPKPEFSQWLMEIVADDETIEFVSHTFNQHDWKIRTDNSGRAYLDHKKFAAFNTVGEVDQFANEFILRLCALSKLITGKVLRIKDAGAFEFRKDGTCSVFMRVAPIKIELNASAVVTIINSGDGSVDTVSADGVRTLTDSSGQVVYRESPADRIADHLARLDESDLVTKVCRLIVQKDIDFVNGYRILEVIREDLGDWNAVESFAGKDQVRRFKQTANTSASGDDSRHGGTRHDPPENPMSQKSAASFIYGVAKRWIEQKSQPKH